MAIDGSAKSDHQVSGQGCLTRAPYLIRALARKFGGTVSISVICCCVTNYPNMQFPKTTSICHLTVPVGQDSRHGAQLRVSQTAGIARLNWGRVLSRAPPWLLAGLGAKRQLLPEWVFPQGSSLQGQRGGGSTQDRSRSLFVTCSQMGHPISFAVFSWLEVSHWVQPAVHRGVTQGAGITGAHEAAHHTWGEEFSL